MDTPLCCRVYTGTVFLRDQWQDLPNFKICISDNLAIFLPEIIPEESPQRDTDVCEGVCVSTHVCIKRFNIELIKSKKCLSAGG